MNTWQKKEETYVTKRGEYKYIRWAWWGKPSGCGKHGMSWGKWGGAPGGGSWQFVEHVHEYGHACMHMRNTHGAWGAYGCMGMWDWVDSRYEIISTGATTTYHYSTPWLRSMGPFIKTSIIPLYFGIPRCRIVNSCTLQK